MTNKNESSHYKNYIKKTILSGSFNESIDHIHYLITHPSILSLIYGDSFNYEIPNEKEVDEIGCLHIIKFNNSKSVMKVIDSYDSENYKFHATSIIPEDVKQPPYVLKYSWFFDTTKRKTIFTIEKYLNPKDHFNHTENNLITYFQANRKRIVYGIDEWLKREIQYNGTLINSIILNRPLMLIYNIIKDFGLLSRITERLTISDKTNDELKDLKKESKEEEEDRKCSWLTLLENEEKSQNIARRYKVSDTYINEDRTVGSINIGNSDSNESNFMNFQNYSLIKLSSVSCFLEWRCKLGVYWTEQEKDYLLNFNKKILINFRKHIERLNWFED